MRTMPVRFRVGTAMILMIAVAFALYGGWLWERRDYCLERAAELENTAARHTAIAETEARSVRSHRRRADELRMGPFLVFLHGRNGINRHTLIRDRPRLVREAEGSAKTAATAAALYRSLADQDRHRATAYRRVAHQPWLSLSSVAESLGPE